MTLAEHRSAWPARDEMPRPVEPVRSWAAEHVQARRVWFTLSIVRCSNENIGQLCCRGVSDGYAHGPTAGSVDKTWSQPRRGVHAPDDSGAGVTQSRTGAWGSMTLGRLGTFDEVQAPHGCPCSCSGPLGLAFLDEGQCTLLGVRACEDVVEH
jgi:hypothetical protein